MTLHVLLRRHSAACALLAVLAAAVAAPYLIPQNPDSAVFRSGVFGALLIAGCFFPTRQAFDRHNTRSLLYGSGFALLFALCLGIGSELTVYEQFLPGLGSLIRRFAVPLLATPLLGALTSYFFERKPGYENSSRLHIPFLGYFLLFTAVYAAVLFAMFPGILNYDFEFEIAQFITRRFEAKHPVFHTLLLGILYRIGELISGSTTGGAFLYSAVQLVLVAAMYAAVCHFVQKRVPPLVMLLLTLCFAGLPFHGIIAISTVKDALFSGLCLLLCAMLWHIAEEPDAFLENPRQIARFIACCLAVALVRLNGIFAYLPACIALLVLCRKNRSLAGRRVFIAGLTLAVCLLVPRGLEFALHAEKAPSSEMMSVPCQQLMRTAEYADLTEEEYAALNEWFSGATNRYRPYSADPAKGGNFDFERYQRDPFDYWSTYLRYAKRYPRIYLEAFLQNCAGLWNPDDVSHAHAMDGEDWDFVYLKTLNIVPEIAGTVKAHSFIPALRSFLNSVAHSSRHERIPFISLLFRPSTYTFLLLLTTLLLLYRRAGWRALCLLPIWGILLSLFFSACILVRYAYPIMTAVPVLLALAFGERATEE